jgi:aspartate oxidase
MRAAFLAEMHSCGACAVAEVIATGALKREEQRGVHLTELVCAFEADLLARRLVCIRMAIW